MLEYVQTIQLDIRRKVLKFNCECYYCAGAYTGSYTWKVHGDLIWIEIPKNASTTLKRRYDKAPFKMHNIVKIDTTQFKEGFVILRDPVDRFRSLLAHYFLPNGKKYSHGKKWIKAITKNTVNGNNVCELVLQNFKYLEYVIEPHHWSTQASFIPQEFYDLENKNFFGMRWVKQNFPISNKSPSEKVVITKIEETKIKQLYAEDYDLLKRIKGEI